MPLAVYTTASYVFSATREIIKNANLNAEEHDRMAAILIESAKQINTYNHQLQAQISQIDQKQRIVMDEFLRSFDYNLETGVDCQVNLTHTEHFYIDIYKRKESHCQGSKNDIQCFLDILQYLKDSFETIEASTSW